MSPSCLLSSYVITFPPVLEAPWLTSGEPRDTAQIACHFFLEASASL